VGGETLVRVGFGLSETVFATSDTFPLRQVPSLYRLSAFPGWEAWIDGAEARIVRTDYVLRGISLPAGEHRIRLVFGPRSVVVVLSVSAATFLAMAAVGAVWLRRRRRPQG
jgi:MYXO-CTERM domain-containing protein